MSSLAQELGSWTHPVARTMDLPRATRHDRLRLALPGAADRGARLDPHRIGQPEEAFKKGVRQLGA